AACAPAPCDAGATEVAADRDSPSSAPRSAGNDPPTATAKSVVHPADPSSACVLACCGSPRHLRSTTQSVVRPAVVRTSLPARWLPFLPVPSCLPEHGRTSPPLRDALIVFPGTLRCQYPPKQFAETRDGNLLL